MICYQDLREMMEMLIKRFLLLSHIEFNMIKVLVKTFIIKLEQMNVFSPRKYGKIRTRKTLYFTKCLPLQNMRNEYNICQYCMRLMCDNPFISSTCSLFNLFEKKTMFKHETCFQASEISKQATC